MRSLENARWVLSHAAEAMFLADDAGRVVHANDGYLAMGGLALDDALGAGWTRAIEASDLDPLVSAWTSFVEGGSSFGQTFRFVHQRTGRVQWTRVSASRLFDDEGRLLGFLGQCADVTDLVEAQRDARVRAWQESRLARQLAESEERLQLAMAASRDGLWDWEVSSGRLFWSDRVFSILGLSKEAFGGELADFLERVHPDDRAATEARIQAHLATGVLDDMEFRMLGADGRSLWMRAKGQASWDETGAPARMVGTLADVSVEVETRQLIAEKTVALERSNAELERFAAIASHDMREPLRKIGWFVDRVQKRAAGLDERSRQDLERVSSSATRLGTMVSELLDYARTPTFARKRAEVATESLVREVVEPLRSELEALEGTLTVEALPPVAGNPVLVRQVFRNLCGNAFKYRHPDRPPRIVVRSEEAGDLVRFVVEDNGIGFAEQYTERIFGLFERLHGKCEYPGTGLGLALVRRIAEELGGRAWAEGREGEGASFYVELPAVGSLAPPSRETLPA